MARITTAIRARVESILNSGVDTVNADSVNTEQLSNAHYATAYDGANGGEQIQNAVDAAVKNSDSPTVVVDGDGPDDVSGDAGSLSDARAASAWALTSSISVPDNVTLVFINSYLFLKGGTDDNLIENADAGTSRNANISIEGIGDPILDGNASNQTSLVRENEGAEDNLGLRFYLIDDLTIENITMRNTNAWAIKAEDGENWDFKNIEFDQDESTQNQDGLDIVGPATDVDIDWLTGVTGDDMLAIRTARPQGGDLLNEGAGGDITDVSVGTIKSNVTGNNAIRLQAEDGTILSDVHVGRVYVNGTGVAGSTAFRVGFGQASNSKDDIENVTIDQLKSVNADAPVVIESPCRKITIDSLTAESNREFQSSEVIRLDADIDDFVMNGIDISGNWKRGIYQNSGTLTDATIRNLTADLINSNGNEIGNVFNPTATVVNVTASDWTVHNAKLLFGGPTGASVSGVMRNVNVGSIADELFNSQRTYSLRFAGDFPEYDVRDMGNINNSRAVHDGSGTNTQGPAYNDGSGWVSLVDGSTIS